MSKSTEYRELARQWSHDDLLAKWYLIKDHIDINPFPPGIALEYLVIRAYELEIQELGTPNSAVRWPFEVESEHQTRVRGREIRVLEQIDGVVHLGMLSFLIECKRTKVRTPIETLAKLHFRLASRPPTTIGLVFATSDYTDVTEVLARTMRPMNILLWTAQDIEYAIAERRMIPSTIEKLRAAVHSGSPLSTIYQGGAT